MNSCKSLRCFGRFSPWISALTSRRALIQTNARVVISLNNTVLVASISDQFEILIDKLCILLKFGIQYRCQSQTTLSTNVAFMLFLNCGDSILYFFRVLQQTTNYTVQFSLYCDIFLEYVIVKFVNVYTVEQVQF